MRLLCAAVTGCLLLPSGLAAQGGCRARSAADAEAGWRAYAAGDVEEAARRFEEALMEAWLARAMEETVAHEMATYHEQRPVAFTSWPTLDPLQHPAETSVAEEIAIRTALGESMTVHPREYDNDAISLDANHVRPMERMPAGTFASYHAYPYYPDFMVLPGLRDDAASSLGRSAYFGYLRALRDHHEGLPVVIAEYGVPRRATPPADTLRAAAAAAWDEGDTGRAFALYERVLAAHPDDPVALHRVALVHAWEERYARSLELFDRLVGDIAPEDPSVHVDRARVLAWSGDTPAALAALEPVIEAHPDYLPALEARAQFETWQGHYDESLDAYDALLAIAPEDRDARMRRAQVLSWASSFDASVAAWDSLLARDPDDLEARLGRAQALAWSDRLEEAIAEYDRALERAPRHPAALRGKGRVLGWAGRLVEGEAALRAAAGGEGDPDALALLAENLRWQGRQAAALEVLEEARRLDPTHADVRAQIRQLESALAPSAAPSLVFESDSDGNRMRTLSVAAGWHPSARLSMRIDAYDRALEQGALARSSFGVHATATGELDPGWLIRVGLGGTMVEAARAPGDLPPPEDEAAPGSAQPELHPSVRIGVSTPGRYRVGATLSLSTSTLDATAALADRAVQVSEASLSFRWQPAARWRIDGSVGRAGFSSAEENRRTSAYLSASRTLPHGLVLGASARGFAFAEDLDEGYFDPDFYGILEIPVRWNVRAGGFGLLLEAAPGVQKVTYDGALAGTVRASVRLARALGPGREIALAGGYSSTGLQSFSTGSSDYRYRAVILSAGWSF